MAVGGRTGGPLCWGSRGLATRGRVAAVGHTIECHGGGMGLSLQGELLKDKLIAGVVEGVEWYDSLDESLQVVIAAAETTQKVQDEDAVEDKLIEITEGVRHAIHSTVVLADGEVP